MDDILLQYRQLGDIFDTFSMGVMIVGADRKIISLNHSAEIITGYNESDLKGEYCQNTLLDSLCGGQCEYLSAVESGRQTRVGRCRSLLQPACRRALSGVDRVVAQASC